VALARQKTFVLSYFQTEQISHLPDVQANQARFFMTWYGHFEDNSKADDCGFTIGPPVKGPVNGLKSIVFALVRIVLD
jgi:hypothetical protein